LTDPDEQRVTIRRRGTGFAAESLRFYIWEEDAGELLRSAAAMAEGIGARRVRSRAVPARRLVRTPRRLA
jgi:hypothetical protein